MTAGLTIWDADGNKTLDPADRLTRIVGFRDVQASGMLNDAGLGKGEPFFVCNFMGDVAGVPNPMGMPLWPPEVSFSGTTMTWTFDTANVRKWRIVYGVF